MATLNLARHLFAVPLVIVLVILLVLGCASEEQKDRDFFTSGSSEADQRAEQRIAREQQLRGEDEAELASDDGDKDLKAEGMTTLYERLGGQEGIKAIVDDFTTRVLADPRVNWERKGITRGGFSFSRNESVAWDPNPKNVERLKKHMTQFLALATGGPAVYEGRDIKAVHGMMHITNPEFDATIGDMKATLDKLRVPIDEQKELLAILESTRPQVAEER